ncbi:MAG: hypothetical protein AAFV77_02885 [Planctomycetota bacterium]
MPDEATSCAFADAVAAFGERVDGLTPVSEDSRVREHARHDDRVSPPAVEAIVETQEVFVRDGAAPADFGAVLWCAQSRKLRQRLTAVSCLSLTSGHYVLGQQAVVWLMRHRHQYPRMVAVDAVSNAMPVDLARWILSRGLEDRARNVRDIATQGVLNADDRQMLPALQRASDCEADESLREMMATYFDVGSTGVHVEARGTSRTIVSRDRWTRGMCYEFSSEASADEEQAAILEGRASRTWSAPMPEHRPTASPWWELRPSERPWLIKLIEGRDIAKLLQARNEAQSLESLT